MNAGMKLIKFLLLGFNFVFIVFGFVLIGVGAAVEIKYREVVTVSSNAISAAPILMVVIGVFILLISFFGCCGAYKENYCMVSTFAVLMSFIFVLELAAVISAYVLRAKIEFYLEHSFNKTIKEYKPASDNPFNFIQEKFRCCGSHSPQDWESSLEFQDTASHIIEDKNITKRPVAVPDSCCLTVATDCGLKNGTAIYSEGCVKTIEESFKSRILTVAIIGLVVIFVECTGIAFSCLLMRSIKANYEIV